MLAKYGTFVEKCCALGVPCKNTPPPSADLFPKRYRFFSVRCIRSTSSDFADLRVSRPLPPICRLFCIICHQTILYYILTIFTTSKNEGFTISCLDDSPPFFNHFDSPQPWRRYQAIVHNQILSPFLMVSSCMVEIKAVFL
jgi:hypothetical protein